MSDAPPLMAPAALPPKVRLMVCLFTYDRWVCDQLVTWACGVGPRLTDHPRVDRVSVGTTHGYPTDRARNAACKEARDQGFDFLLMVDDDTLPDCELGRDPAAVPFLPAALDFALAHDGPCLVGAPYCTAPPLQEVVVMKYREAVPDTPGGAGFRIDKYTRDEAAQQAGIGRVAALPTGCLLVDLRALAVLPPPWFHYEFADPPFNTRLASTEDIAFTRNCDWVGVPSYCTWDSWAAHQKSFLVGKPKASPVDEVPAAVWRAFQAGHRPKLYAPPGVAPAG
jgi:hypothetical protein